jgi:hypothetical protein
VVVQRSAASVREAQAPASGPGRDQGSVALDWVDRLVGGYDLDGPRVRMGVLWFALAVGATLVGPVAVGALFGLVAGVAGAQTAGAWRRTGLPADPLVAGLGALAVGLAAVAGIALAGLAVLAVVVVAFVAASTSRRRRRRRIPTLLTASMTVRASVFVGVAAASAVFLARTETAALMCLVLLVSGFEVGDYLVGTGASTAVEGPLAGIAAVVVLTFALAVFGFAPFDTGSTWVFGGLVAVLAPLGRFTAAILVPEPGARVPALRRLDSYLIAAPIWAWMSWGYLL